ncbi:vacuolar protein sorting-associated protein Vps17 [Neurospora hispaniola]|uniref:Vacuolar protein sorting-associated protein 17 n=1 Tax=Neurospora hispaniola TaxID=588809 RepID=A0AAJ0MME4_9PEZI|nr:vacuolar protein sorting-associated protein Vps17 [Neurospora hispaniola]
MDYSASINDTEHAAGSSPWGNSPSSSPRPTRSTFASTIIPDDYVPPTPNNGLDDEGGFGAGDNGFRRHDSTDAPEAQSGALFSDHVPSGQPQQEGQAHDSHGEAHPQSQTESHREPQTENGQHQQPQEQQHHAQYPPHQQQQQQQQQQYQQYQQQPPPQQQPYSPHQQVQQQFRRPQPQFKLQAKITGLERTGRKDPILRFDVHTNLPSFRTTQYRDVRRLHSEFIKLAEHLISANPEAIVPAVPPALTSAGAGTDEDEARVKALMQRWFNYVCSNEVLMRDDEMVLFTESDFGYSPMVKKKQPATGVRRKILKQFAPPPDDTPELQEARPIVKLFYLGAMDAGHKVDKLVKTRRGLGLVEADYGIKLSNMHIQEPHPGLSNAYRKLGKVLQTVGDLHAAQATAEATTIGDPFQYHSSDAFIVKETLTNRQILMRELLQAQELTRSKLHAADRLKSSSNVRRERVDEAIAALRDAQEAESTLQHKTTRVTQNLVHERRKWFARTAADMRLSIREYVLRQIEAERRTLALLESVRPDIRAIDSSGGLSRLGRESHPTVRRASLAASQGPKGDAWSGVPRARLGEAGSVSGARSISGSFMAGSVLGVGAGGGVEGEEAGGEDAERPGSGGARGAVGGLVGLPEEDDEDRVDARNAASRLATSTF